jgi:glycosyltransferase involved in cell wall biosynthesis
MFGKASLVIGCSRKVTEQIRLIGAQNVATLEEGIDTERVVARPLKAQSIRKSLGIPDHSYVWAMSGMTQYRKGLDLVPDLMEGLRHHNAHLIWIGKTRDTGYDHYTSREIEKRGLTNVHFVGEKTTDYYDHLSCADGFVLTSRHDPFPLVMIEAALLGKPIVSFNSGGVKDFVLRKMGEVIDSWNVSDLVTVMVKVMKGHVTLDPSVSHDRALEFDIKIQTKRWERIMLDHFAAGVLNPRQPVMRHRWPCR